MHAEAYEFCRYAAGKIGRYIDMSEASMLDVGGRNVNGSVHELFPVYSVTTTDIIEGEGVDFVVDFSIKDIPKYLSWGSKFDIVISTEVLEHAPDWRNIVENMIESTKPGGWVVITCATTGRPPHSAIDGHFLTDEDEEFYANVTDHDLVLAVQDLDIDLIYINTTTTHCDLQALMRKK